MTYDDGPKGFLREWSWVDDHTLAAWPEITDEGGHVILEGRIYVFHLKESILSRLDLTALQLNKGDVVKLKGVHAESNGLKFSAGHSVVYARADLKSPPGKTVEAAPSEPEPTDAPASVGVGSVSLPSEKTAGAGGLTFPAGGAGIEEWSTSEFPAAFTAAELADPPEGRIRKSYLREIGRVRTEVTRILADVPPGTNTEGLPWYNHAKAFAAGLDRFAVGAQQLDCFALIPSMAELFGARKKDAPLFALECGGLANDLSPVLVHAIERHIIDRNGDVPAETVKHFATFFSIRGFLSAGDWENTPVPIDPPGILVLDAAAVVAHLKSRPWQEAQQFLGNATAAQAFGPFGADGNGMRVLKAKYADQKLTIEALWDDLSAWVAAQQLDD